MSESSEAQTQHDLPCSPWSASHRVEVKNDIAISVYSCHDERSLVSINHPQVSFLRNASGKCKKSKYIMRSAKQLRKFRSFNSFISKHLSLFGVVSALFLSPLRILTILNSSGFLAYNPILLSPSCKRLADMTPKKTGSF